MGVFDIALEKFYGTNGTSLIVPARSRATNCDGAAKVLSRLI
jgi:hypothetical protein